MNAEKYKRRNKRWRKALGALNPKAGRMIAYENAKRLFGKTRIKFVNGQWKSRATSNSPLLNSQFGPPNPTWNLIVKGNSGTSGKSVGLICEPFKVVWPDYAGVFLT